MRRMYPFVVGGLLALILAGCGSSNDSSESPIASLPTPGATSPWMEPSAAPSAGAAPILTEQPAKDNQQSTADPKQQAVLKEIGREVVEVLRARDLNSLANWIAPDNGLRFSPYSHINPSTDLVFKADTLPSFKDTNKLTWGVEDGSGEPIELTFRSYFERFVYNQDFAGATHVNVNQLIGVSNSPFNASEVYPNASYVEFHYPGFDKQYNGLDWESLILVFTPHDDNWKLSAIVHGQWTI